MKEGSDLRSRRIWRQVNLVDAQDVVGRVLAVEERVVARDGERLFINADRLAED